MKVASGPCQAAHLLKLCPHYLTLKAGLLKKKITIARDVSLRVRLSPWTHPHVWPSFMDSCLWQPHPTGQDSLGSSKCPGRDAGAVFLDLAKLFFFFFPETEFSCKQAQTM